MKEPRKHLSLSVSIPVYESIKELAEENEITMTKAINSILMGYLRSREARRKKDTANG